MLLDEPTNHLDIRAIGWLEEQLAATTSAFVIISHDRAVLRNVARATLWVDRGQVRRQDKGFDAFEGWRDKTWDEEDHATPQAEAADQGRGPLGGRGDLGAAQAQPGPGARVAGSAGRTSGSQITRQGAAAMDAGCSRPKVRQAGL